MKPGPFSPEKWQSLSHLCIGPFGRTTVLRPSLPKVLRIFWIVSWPTPLFKTHRFTSFLTIRGRVQNHLERSDWKIFILEKLNPSENIGSLITKLELREAGSCLSNVRIRVITFTPLRFP